MGIDIDPHRPHQHRVVVTSTAVEIVHALGITLDHVLEIDVVTLAAPLGLAIDVDPLGVVIDVVPTVGLVLHPDRSTHATPLMVLNVLTIHVLRRLLARSLTHASRFEMGRHHQTHLIVGQ